MFKRLFVLFFFLATTSVYAQDNAAETCPDVPYSRLSINHYARVRLGNRPITVHTEATETSEALGRIPAGGIMRVNDGPVCAEDNAWWYVEYRGLNGWTTEGENDTYRLEPVADEDAPVLDVEGLSEVIVYESRDENRHYEVFVIDLNGNVSVSLTPPDENDHNPTVSPDHSQIAFYTPNARLAVMGVDGSFRHRLNDNYLGVNFTWSGDSRYLAVAVEESYVDQSYVVHFLIPIDGRQPFRLDLSIYYRIGVISPPTWSPDGTQVAYTQDHVKYESLWITDAALEGNQPCELVSMDANLGIPEWSPDGTAIAFSASDQYFVVDVDGSNLRQPTGEGLDTQEFAWSPDGSRIAFVSERSGYSEIYVVNADGSNLTQITHDEACAMNPAWSPDGESIVFISNRDRERRNLCEGDVYVMDADGNNVRRLTDNGRDNQNPQWITIAPPLPPE